MSYRFLISENIIVTFAISCEEWSDCIQLQKRKLSLQATEKSSVLSSISAEDTESLLLP